jgi:hypothetical protein
MSIKKCDDFGLNRKEQTHIDRGFELMLRNRRDPEKKPKNFGIYLEKMVSLFHREIHFKFELSFGINKNKLSGRKSC